MRSRSIALALVVVALAACGGSSGGPSGPSGSVHPTAAPSLEPLEQPADRCGGPTRKADVFRFFTGDGVRLDAAMIGGGVYGVILAHQYPSSLCGWWPYANYLARHDYRVMLFDFRCFGGSECPTGERRWGLTSDLQAASDQLRHRGARHVALVGASMGASAALVAAQTIQPPVSSVVDLSGPPDLGNLGAPIAPGESISRLIRPVLFVVARDDPAVTVAETRSMYERAGSPADTKQLIVLPAAQGHGWDMLTKSLDVWGPLAMQVLRFLESHSF